VTNLDFARAQMALSLPFHIVFAAVGVGGAVAPAVGGARPGSVRGVSGDPGGGR